MAEAAINFHGHSLVISHILCRSIRVISFGLIFLRPTVMLDISLRMNPEWTDFDTEALRGVYE